MVCQVAVGNLYPVIEKATDRKTKRTLQGKPKIPRYDAHGAIIDWGPVGSNDAEKKTGQPIDPHTPKAECDRLFREGLIHGCGKPFKFDGVNLTICDYI